MRAQRGINWNFFVLHMHLLHVFSNTLEAGIVENHYKPPKNSSNLKFDLMGTFIGCVENLVIIGWSIGK